ERVSASAADQGVVASAAKQVIDAAKSAQRVGDAARSCCVYEVGEIVARAIRRRSLKEQLLDVGGQRVGRQIPSVDTIGRALVEVCDDNVGGVVHAIIVVASSTLHRVSRAVANAAI